LLNSAQNCIRNDMLYALSDMVSCIPVYQYEPDEVEGGRDAYVAVPLGFSPPPSGFVGGRGTLLWGAWNPRLHSAFYTLRIALSVTDCTGILATHWRLSSFRGMLEEDGGFTATRIVM
jgi:hypothetical protein